MAIYKQCKTKKAPLKDSGIFLWIRKRLISSPLDIFLTLISILTIYLTVPPVLDFLIFDATWSGSKSEITNDGARWIFIYEKLSQFMYGFYPEKETYRNLLSVGVVVGFIAVLIYAKNKYIKIVSAVISVVVIFILVYGGFGLPVITTDKWGGLMLTILVSSITIIVSFPIGIALALGRRSDMPIIRYFCTGFIEFFRGIPLITILFMASVVLPLFFSDGLDFDKLARAIIGFVLFHSAYTAEAVRGGLQAVDKGQYEAAQTEGLGYWQTMILIILPQALKISIPNIVGISIALLKDTSLLLIIGVFDILAMITMTTGDPAWLGFELEGYVFVAFVYWIICFSLSKYSSHIERKLHRGR